MRSVGVILVCVAALVAGIYTALADEPPAKPDWRQITIAGEKYYCIPEDVAGALGFRRRDIPDEKNAATYYLQVMDRWPRFLDDLPEADDPRVSEEPWKPEEFPAVADWIRRNQQAFELVEKGMAQDECQFLLLMRRAGGTVLAEITLPYLAAMRQWARAFVIRANMYEGQGELARAAEQYVAVLKLGSHAAQEEIFIGGLVGIAVERIGLTALQRFLWRHELPADELRKILTHLLQAPALLPDPVVAMRGERIMGLNGLEQLLGGKNGGAITGVPDDRTPAQRAFMSGRAWKVLIPNRTMKRDFERCYDTLIAVASREPWDYARSRLSDVGLQMKPWNVPASYLLPAVDRVFREYASSRTMLYGMSLDVALRLYRAEHGRYPEKLDELAEYLPGALPDPFTGNPFLYLTWGEDFLLYSVGPNLRDDGGVPREVAQGENYDIVFTSKR